MKLKGLLSVSMLVAGLVAPRIALAEESKCPLEIGACLYAYQAARERPWLGIEVEMDSVSQRPRIKQIVPGGPAEKSRLRVGDIIRSIDGQVPRDWFAGKAGWKDAGVPLAFDVVRGGTEVAFAMRPGRMNEELLARMIGVHMLEGHLAHMQDPAAKATEQ